MNILEILKLMEITSSSGPNIYARSEEFTIQCISYIKKKTKILKMIIYKSVKLE